MGFFVEASLFHQHQLEMDDFDGFDSEAFEQEMFPNMTEMLNHSSLNGFSDEVPYKLNNDLID